MVTNIIYTIWENTVLVWNYMKCMKCTTSKECSHKVKFCLVSHLLVWMKMMEFSFLHLSNEKQMSFWSIALSLLGKYRELPQ